MPEAELPPRTGPEVPVVALLLTGPGSAVLAELGRTLVEEGLAACVNVLPGARSIFRWEGRVEEEDEAVAIVKSVGPLVPAIARRVRELHPYDLPEVLALPTAGGSEAYAGWVRDAVAGRLGDES